MVDPYGYESLLRARHQQDWFLFPQVSLLLPEHLTRYLHEFPLSSRHEVYGSPIPSLSFIDDSAFWAGSKKIDCVQ